MHGVTGSFKHKNGEKIKGTFELRSKDKNLKPGKKWKPLKWKGKVNNKKVEIIQLCADPSTIEDFNWKEFPKKYEVVKAYIADAIEEYFAEQD